jgi:regulator of extracellular matrix RemA (YlzA/DUF370 family)
VLGAFLEVVGCAVRGSTLSTNGVVHVVSGKVGPIKRVIRRFSANCGGNISVGINVAKRFAITTNGSYWLANYAL